MKRFIAAVAVVAAIAFAAVPVQAQSADAVAQAERAAKSWLALTDAGEYSRSWDEAAGTIRAAVSKSRWASTVRGTRHSLGDVGVRKLKSAVFTRTLAGAPDGEYVVIEYESTFENRVTAVETVTPSREKDGSWKVAGYLIR